MRVGREGGRVAAVAAQRRQQLIVRVHQHQSRRRLQAIVTHIQVTACCAVARAGGLCGRHDVAGD